MFNIDIKVLLSIFTTVPSDYNSINQVYNELETKQINEKII